MQWLYGVLIIAGLIISLAIIWKILQRFFPSIITEEQKRRLQGIEKGQKEISQAINGFASAMGEYAKHLENHTAAIQNLAEVSKELSKTAQEQTKFLKGLTEFLEDAKKRGG